MRIASQFSTLAACVLCFVPLAGAQVRQQKDIAYTSGAHGPLLADAYLPAGDGRFPAILYIHGGGWLNGDRSQMARLIRDLAAQGYAGFTIDYDLAPTHFPAALHESLAALEYMRSHAAELHIDPSRIAVAGSSAGGELAALVALNAGEVKPPQAAIILNGVLDLTALGDKSNMVTQYLGTVCSQTAGDCKDASPQSHAHPGAPPFFVGHGTADQTVPYAQAEAFVSSLRAVKVQVRFFTAKGGPHTYWAKQEFYQQNLDAITQFLAMALRPNGP